MLTFRLKGGTFFEKSKIDIKNEDNPIIIFKIFLETIIIAFMLRLIYIIIIWRCQILKIEIVYTKNVVILFLLLIFGLKEINKYNNK